MEPKNPNMTQISTTTIDLTSASTSTSTNLRIETTGYPKGFKFILPKPFQGAQNDVEPWLFNIWKNILIIQVFQSINRFVLQSPI